MYLQFRLAIWCPWKTGASSDPRCTRCAGWCNKEGCTQWRIRDDGYWVRHCRWTGLVLPPCSGTVWHRMSWHPWHHHGFWSWVDGPIEDPQSQVLSGDEVQGVPQVLDHMVAHVVVSSDYATWVRPANENVQERFVYKLMNEPHLLRINEEWKKRQTQNRRKKKTQGRKKKGPNERKNLFSDPTCRLTSFLALTVQYCLLVVRLWFEGWVGTTVLVKSPKCLFQDAPSQFAYLGIAMKSCTDRLPRRTGLCVLFHTHQLLIICVGPWTEWWITRWIRWIWLKDSMRGRCWCLGIGSQSKCRVTRRNGNVGCRLATMAIIDFSVVNGSRCWCGIAVRVIRIEGIGNGFWGNWKRARSDISLCHRQWSFRRIGQFLFLLWLRVNCWRDPLLGTNRNWDCGPRYSTSRFDARWIAWIRIGIRHGNWAVNANGVGWWMVPFHMRWRSQGGGTKVGFRIFHHVWRDASMCYHCGWYWRWRKRNESVEASWSHAVKTEILRRQRVLPMEGSKKGRSPAK